MPSLYIDGTWTSGSGGSAEVINPFDAGVIERVDQAGPDDVERAVAAARTAFDTGPWPHTPAAERGALLRRVADLLMRDKEEIAHTETLDTGKTLVESRIDVDDVTAVFRYYADLAGKDAGRIVDTGNPAVVSRMVHEPVGVCALITPWNYPLLQLSWKVAPALAAGNTVVIKPSEVTPLTSVLLVRLLEEAGAPQGVVNILLGDGRSRRCPAHRARRTSTWSASPAASPPARRSCGQPRTTVKRVAVELGGKNPNIVFADTDFETAVDYALTAVFLHSGQVCSAGARLIVEDALHDDLVAELGPAGRADPAGQRPGRGHRGRPAGLGGAPGEDRGLRGVGAGRGGPAGGGRAPAGGARRCRRASSTGPPCSPTSAATCG